MEVFLGLDKFPPRSSGVVLSLGNFDGVHLGHAQLIQAAATVARRISVPLAVMTFDPHPLAILAPERAPTPLSTAAEKLALLERLGVQCCILVRSEPAFLAQEAGDFLASLVARCRPRALVEGPDFNFGRGRSGNLDTLREHATAWGYEVHTVPALRCAALPTHPVVSSSSIRQALRDGRLDDANLMLGRPYRVVGTVARGHGRGRILGFPTVNLEGIPHGLPQEAVYAAVAQLDNGNLYLAAVNLGPQPTFGQRQRRVEAHLLDFTGDLDGRRVGLHFLARLREQEKFADPRQLADQLQRDVAATRRFADQMRRLGDHPPIPL